MSTLQRISRLFKHRWQENAARQFMTQALQQKLSEHIAQSEAHHTGQIRVYVEGGMPAHYIWRGATARERAVSIFGKTGVWDTEHNNGVLIYLLVAEHAVEIIADRGLRAKIKSQAWQDTILGLTQALRNGQPEAGLVHAVEEIGLLLEEAFPALPETPRDNELPDAPIVR